LLVTPFFKALEVVASALVASASPAPDSPICPAPVNALVLLLDAADAEDVLAVQAGLGDAGVKVPLRESFGCLTLVVPPTAAVVGNLLVTEFPTAFPPLLDVLLLMPMLLLLLLAILVDDVVVVVVAIKPPRALPTMSPKSVILSPMTARHSFKYAVY